MENKNTKKIFSIFNLKKKSKDDNNDKHQEVS